MTIQLTLLAVVIVLLIMILIRIGRAPSLPQDMMVRLATLERIAADLPSSFRDEARISREDMRGSLMQTNQMMEARLTEMEKRFGAFGTLQEEQFSRMRTEATQGRASLEETIQRNAENFAHTQTTRLKETNDAVRDVSDRMTDKVGALMEANANAQEKLREAVSQSLERLQRSNEEKLEGMRATVDEKLQGTLEKRLGESFQLVSSRLEQVHKGLGEMQSIATGVGDLKRVLSNVKSRGGWGEMQLGMLLEDMLAPGQYESNVRIRPASREIVEYAVRLPGRDSSDEPLWLPIDAKFPHEDYERLLQAQEAGMPGEVEKSANALERAVRRQAEQISDKYVHPPFSTDFAIMYLPTEGLFAEVVRRPGLVRDLQNKHRIMVQGPTTLATLLTSLQMGFRTLAIEKRSSEVWKVLGAAKAEFGKYSQVWDKLEKQLATAQRTVSAAGTRTRVIAQRLKDVETLEGPEERATERDPSSHRSLMDEAFPDFSAVEHHEESLKGAEENATMKPR